MFCKALSSKIQTSIKISSYFSTKLSVSYLFCSSVIRKKKQTFRCSSHSNGFQNMSIIALRRKCKCYFKYFFQMSSKFFVFAICCCYYCFCISAAVVYCFIGSYTIRRFLMKCINEFKAKIGISKKWISQELHKASVAL